jgi:hypothetical protein
MKLKNNIRKNIIKINDNLEDFNKELKKIKFDDARKNIKAKITALRHKKIAHFDKNWNIDLSAKSLNELIPELNEIFAICSKINELFDLLCFSEKRSVEYVEYNPKIKRPMEPDYKTDIDEILDNIAKESDLLNMPEKQSEFWPHYKENLTETELEMLNNYRTKFNLPRV